MCLVAPHPTTSSDEQPATTTMSTSGATRGTAHPRQRGRTVLEPWRWRCSPGNSGRAQSFNPRRNHRHFTSATPGTAGWHALSTAATSSRRRRNECATSAADRVHACTQRRPLGGSDAEEVAAPAAAAVAGAGVGVVGAANCEAAFATNVNTWHSRRREAGFRSPWLHPPSSKWACAHTCTACTGCSAADTVVASRWRWRRGGAVAVEAFGTTSGSQVNHQSLAGTERCGRPEEGSQQAHGMQHTAHTHTRRRQRLGHWAANPCFMAPRDGACTQHAPLRTRSSAPWRARRRSHRGCPWMVVGCPVSPDAEVDVASHGPLTHRQQLFPPRLRGSRECYKHYAP